ncbi:MAG: hypothetical protein ACP5FL_07670 [Thermoplasmatota archaeon]
MEAKNMKRKIVGMMVATMMIATGMTFITDTGTADWDPGDGHKMHFPMTPDVDGWDVCATPYSNNTARIADDWECSETGEIRDIHFWGSWKNDNNSTIEGFNIAIASHDSVNSMPGDIIWQRYFAQGEFTVREYTPGCYEGWYAPRHPGNPEVIPDDHLHYYQYNIVNIEDPCRQKIEEIYWLIIDVWLEDYYDFDYGWGWKTSNKTWGCNAVYQKSWGPGNWEELYDPLGGDPAPPLDMAFVITGEECDPTVTIDKTVKDPDTGEFVDGPIQVNSGDTVTFKIEVENTGNDNLQIANVWDIMPPCFDYVDNSADPPEDVYNEYSTSHKIDWWSLSAFDPFSPGDYIDFTYDVTINCNAGTSSNYGFVTWHGCGTTDFEADDIVDIVVINESLVPDLQCSGALNWSDESPGGTVTGSFQVMNGGDEESNLNWEIAEYPDWGTWSFDPSTGANLKPEDGPVEVEVEVECPDEENAAFSGNIKVINTDNTEDYDMVPVTLTTPENKAFDVLPLIQWLQGHHLILFTILSELLNPGYEK